MKLGIMLLLVAVPPSAKAWAHDLSDNTIKHYGRSLALWADIRERCGDDGARETVHSRILSLNSAASAQRAALVEFGTRNGLNEDFVGSARSLASLVSATDTSSLHLGQEAAHATRSLHWMLTQIPAGTGATERGILQGLLRKANLVHQAVQCQRSEDELRFIVARTARAVPAEDASTVEIPNTLGARGIDIQGGHCATLDQLSDSLGSVIEDSNRAVLEGVPFYERAVVTQMVVEYTRRHGRQGVLSQERQTQLREIVTSVLNRFELEHERMAPPAAEVAETE